ncbi:MAG: hypothetical protein H8E97_01250, partial [Bacteroidetes bacterium]|nr:hypothetical protein [Bacteroidota bacterium]
MSRLTLVAAIIVSTLLFSCGADETSNSKPIDDSGSDKTEVGDPPVNAKP